MRTGKGEANAMRSWSELKFEKVVDPMYWWLTASSMKEASELVFKGVEPSRRKPSAWDVDLEKEGFELTHPSHDLRSVYALLVGFSLENLLKAEYMRVNKPKIAEGKLPQAIKTHDLLALLKALKLEPEVDELNMVAVAADAIVSWGRYPGGVQHDKGAMSPPACFDLDDFRQAFEAMYWRLTSAITEGWADETH